MSQFKLGLSFDDVLLIPRRSSISSRRDVILETMFSRHIKLSLPLVSSNMDTVTESKMARVMAELGGLGIIHRFIPIEKQAEEVRRVKRAENVVIEDPYTIAPEKTIKEAQAQMSQLGITGLLVVDEKNKLLGIFTSRDLKFGPPKNSLVKDVMTKKVITAPPKISLAKATDILRKYRIEKLPLVDKKGTVKGLITLKDLLRQTKNSLASKDKKGRLLVGAALGIKDDFLSRAQALLDAGADVLVIDVAHGYNSRVAESLKFLKKKFAGVDVVAGNVATAEGVIDLIKAGADAVKVGIGPGAACTTRLVTGVGVPQLTAIMESASVARAAKVPIIADGGVKNSGDFSKALAAGADTVMVGSLLAGTDEAPGEYLMEDGAAYKLYRGMASYEASSDKKRLDGSKDFYQGTPEGKAGRVPYRGPAKNVIYDLESGLRSSMSYLGAKNLDAFHKNAEFIRMTEAGMKESAARNSFGFSLVEVVVTFGLIAVTLFSYFAVLKTVTLTRFAQHQALAYAVASKKIEELKTLPFASLPSSGAFTDSALSPLTSAQANLTIVDYSGSAKIKDITVSINWQDTGGTKNVEIKSLLTEGGT